MSRTDCPPAEQITAYLLGNLPNAELDSISAHLDACAGCQVRLESVEGATDSLLGQLRNVVAPAFPIADRELQQLLPRAKAIAVTPALPNEVGDPGVVPLHLRNLGGYELLKPLGGGAFGTVYLARGLLLHRFVAVKVLKDVYRTDMDVKARFLQEMRAIGQLQAHPHVVHALQAAEESGTLFLVMEYVVGTDLNQIVKKQGALPVAEACDLIRQAALGLDYIHQHGLIHRDVKPANLILATDGRVKVLDLGLARLLEQPAGDDRQTSSGHIMGTIDYMAPEQARDPRQADRRADVYSLGCTLYRLLTGQVPFPGDNRLDKIDAHRGKAPVPLSNFRKDVPPEVQALVGRMMAKHPNDRPQTAREVAEQLARFGIGADPRIPTPVPGEMPLPSTEELKPSRRWVWGVAVLAALLLVTVAMLLGMFSPGLWTKGGPNGVPIPDRSLTGLERPARSLAFATESGHVAAEDGRYVYTWNLVGSGQMVSWPLGDTGLPAAQPALAPTNVVLAAGGWVVLGRNDSASRSQLYRYDWRTGKPDGLPKPVSAGVISLASSHDGRLILSAENNQWVRIRDAGKLDVSHEFTLDGLVRAAAFTADGQRVLCGGDNGLLRLSDLNGADAKKLDAPKKTIIAVGLSANGQRVYAASLAEQTLRSWDAISGESLAIKADEGDNAMTCAAFAADSHLAFTGHMDGSVAVWDLDHQQCVSRYHKHQGPVSCLAGSADARQLASAGRDDLLVWVYSLNDVRNHDH